MEESKKQHNAAFYSAIRSGDESAALGKNIPYTKSLMQNIKADAEENIKNNRLTDRPEALPQ